MIKRPKIAWPTVLLLLTCLSIIIGSWIFVLADLAPLWSGVIANCIAYHYLFSPAHDAVHGAVSTNKTINNAVGVIAMFPKLLTLPVQTFARIGHLRHHSFAGNPDEDPDFYITSRFSKNPIWLFWGVHYFAYFRERPELLEKTMARISFRRTKIWIAVALYIVLFATFPVEMFWLWLVPLAFELWTIAWLIGYLPHSSYKKEEGAVSEFKITCNRVGMELILSPFFQYQNYHLVHHLYPGVPFYRYVKVWNARKDYHESKDPVMNHVITNKPVCV
ncbi:MAG: fatty acid desaturase [Pseudomonadota bacterium]